MSSLTVTYSDLQVQSYMNTESSYQSKRYRPYDASPHVTRKAMIRSNRFEQYFFDFSFFFHLIFYQIIPKWHQILDYYNYEIS